MSQGSPMLRKIELLGTVYGITHPVCHDSLDAQETALIFTQLEHLILLTSGVLPAFLVHMCSAHSFCSLQSLALERNSTVAPMPGVDVMQGFQLSKKEFESVFLQAAERAEHDKKIDAENRPPVAPTSKSGRLVRIGRKHSLRSRSELSATDSDNDFFPKSDQKRVSEGSRAATRLRPVQRPLVARSAKAAGLRRRLSGIPPIPGRGFAVSAGDRLISTAEEAERYALTCRRTALSLQRKHPPDFEAAGEMFEKAVDARSRCGLFCTIQNADAHVEYAQNLSKRGLTPEAEYHLRMAGDIFRVLDERYVRKYGDVLLYIAVVIDRQGRFNEAENFYRAALGVYRANKLSDDNVQVAIKSLTDNLRAQGRAHEIEDIVQRHFMGTPEKL